MILFGERKGITDEEENLKDTFLTVRVGGSLGTTSGPLTSVGYTVSDPIYTVMI